MGGVDMMANGLARPQAWMGILLAGVAAILLVHGARAGLGQFHYFRAKYGPDAKSPEAIAARARRAAALYPFNYRLCLVAGQAAFAQGGGEGDSAPRREALLRARAWCERGLYLNPHMLELRWLKTRIIGEEESPDAAIRYWREYVDWDYWRPQNHAALVRLCVRADRWDDVNRELEVIRGTEEFASTLQFVDEVRRRASPVSEAGN